MPKAIDLTGRKFNRLAAMREGPRRHNKKAYWCECECGRATKLVTGSDLKCNKVKQCELCRSEQIINRNWIHGHNQRGKVSPTYISWASMMNRCYNENNSKWEYYGGKSITVCERWHTYENFLQDMGERPEGKTIDRIDNNGRYESMNCRWADATTQSKNRDFSYVSFMERDEYGRFK